MIAFVTANNVARSPLPQNW